MPNLIHAKKSLGQHFLTCPWVISDMIEAAQLSPLDTVLEIGPGTGVLTRPLAIRVKKVITVEKDEKLAHAFALVDTFNNLETMQKVDALEKVAEERGISEEDLQAYFEKKGSPKFVSAFSLNQW